MSPNLNATVPPSLAEFIAAAVGKLAPGAELEFRIKLPPYSDPPPSAAAQANPPDALSVDQRRAIAILNEAGRPLRLHELRRLFGGARTDKSFERMLTGLAKGGFIAHPRTGVYCCPTAATNHNEAQPLPTPDATPNPWDAQRLAALCPTEPTAREVVLLHATRAGLSINKAKTLLAEAVHLGLVSQVRGQAKGRSKNAMCLSRVPQPPLPGALP